MRAPVVHLELCTDNLPRACAFYTQLFGWSAETIHAEPGTYLALGLGEGIEGGVVERDGGRALWLPYVQVADIAETIGARPPARSARRARAARGPGRLARVLAAPAGAEIALWQPKG